MKLALFQEVLDLNRAFERVMRGLTKLENVRAFSTEQIRRVRAEVETARVDANREFFDNFDAMVEDDASWAYKFQREYDRKTKDLDDVYFDIKDAEERRKKKGLPPRVAILPGWDVSDEDRYDEEQAEKKKRAARKRAIAAKQHRTTSGRSKKRSQTAATQRPEGQAKRNPRAKSG